MQPRPITIFVFGSIAHVASTSLGVGARDDADRLGRRALDRARLEERRLRDARVAPVVIGREVHVALGVLDQEERGRAGRRLGHAVLIRRGEEVISDDVLADLLR